MMFSLVLPVYNEAKILESSVGKVSKAMDGLDIDYEIIIAEDGSTDGTDRIAARLAKKNKKIRYIHHDKKLGRGRAFSIAAKKARGDVIGFIDADMATGVGFLKDLVKYSRKYEVVTGSRYVPGSKIQRPPVREFVSRAYNALIRFALGVQLYDSQCGFKAFSRRFVENELDKIRENTWAWDAVALVHAIKTGYSFKEFPVDWKERREAAHSASMDRIMHDVRIHGNVVIKMFLKWRLRLPVDL